MRTVVFVAAVTLGSALCGQARAQEEPEHHRDSTPQSQVALGYRGAIVRDAGYDPFSSNDWFSQSSVAGSHVLLMRGRFSFAVGAAWDYGRASGTTRGSGSALTVHRLTAPLTVRYALARSMYVFGTIAPGAAYEGARIADASATAPLVESTWVAAADASAGAAWSFLDTRPISWWLTAELGYGMAAPTSLTLSPEGSDPQRTGSTNLGSLAMSGSFGRVGMAVAF